MNVDPMTRTLRRHGYTHTGTRTIDALDIQPPPFVIDALCAQIDSGDLFFPPRGGSTEDAKRICMLCTQRIACLAYGMDEDFGVYGGTTAAQRQRMRRERGAPCPKCLRIVVNMDAHRARCAKAAA